MRSYRFTDEIFDLKHAGGFFLEHEAERYITEMVGEAFPHDWIPLPPSSGNISKEIVCRVGLLNDVASSQATIVFSSEADSRNKFAHLNQGDLPSP